ncbi:MAG: hypothetical protein IKF17_03780 [Clostridia bacterium]|nr:hypothetical protein [Clostridia bacterium]
MNETANNVTENIINTINTIFENLFSSIDNNLYSILDDITFITSDIIKDKQFEKILGTGTTNGILLIANSLLIGVIIYYGIKLLLSNFTYSQTEMPTQFIFKLLIFGICMNSSYFIIEEFIGIISSISQAIRDIGEDLFGKNICFAELITTINNSASFNTASINIFSIDGLIKGTLTLSILGLVFTYALRYIMIKVFILLSPFAFLTLAQNSTAWFFKSWIKSIFSLLFIQVIVSIILVIMFSMDFSSNNLLNKLLYVGGIYALIRANSFVREFIGGVSTDIQSNVGNLFKFYK